MQADDSTESEYEIRVKGHLDARWASRFAGLGLTNEDDGTTVVRGPVVDQAALHGLLQQFRDMGLPLLSVTPAQVDGSGAPTTDPCYPNPRKKNRT